MLLGSDQSAHLHLERTSDQAIDAAGVSRVGENSMISTQTSCQLATGKAQLDGDPPLAAEIAATRGALSPVRSRGASLDSNVPALTPLAIATASAASTALVERVYKKLALIHISPHRTLWNGDLD
jgi:hypothetical protein